MNWGVMFSGVGWLCEDPSLLGLSLGLLLVEVWMMVQEL